MLLFDSNLYDDIDLTPGNMNFVLFVLQILAVIFSFRVWLIAEL
jgi:hypothetical protein